MTLLTSPASAARRLPGASMAALVAMALTLAGCTSDADAQAPSQTPPAAEPAAPPAETPAVTTPATPIAPTSRLTALTGEDFEAAALPGELGCSFAVVADETLLIAFGNVASQTPAEGIITVAGTVDRIATAGGGFDAMLAGATFTGASGTTVIAVTGPATEGGESPPSPATLTFDGTDGWHEELVGQWSCGP